MQYPTYTAALLNNPSSDIYYNQDMQIYVVMNEIMILAYPDYVKVLPEQQLCSLQDTLLTNEGLEVGDQVYDTSSKKLTLCDSENIQRLRSLAGFDCLFVVKKAKANISGVQITSLDDLNYNSSAYAVVTVDSEFKITAYCNMKGLALYPDEKSAIAAATKANVENNIDNNETYLPARIALLPSARKQYQEEAKNRRKVLELVDFVNHSVKLDNSISQKDLYALLRGLSAADMIKIKNW